MSDQAKPSPGMVEKAFQAAFNAMEKLDKTAIEEIKNNNYNLSTWKNSGRIRTSLAGSAGAAIPGVHGAGVAAELPYLFRRMAIGALGIGHLMGAKLAPQDDLGAIFALWCHAIKEDDMRAAVGVTVTVGGIAYPAFGAKVLAIGFQVAGKVVAKAAGSHALNHAVNIVANTVVQPFAYKVLSKISAKIGVKVVAKVSGKIVSGFIPLLGPLVSGGINLYIISTFLESAETYYKYKLQDEKKQK